MAFTFTLNDGTEYEFPTANETGKLKAALRRTRKMPKEGPGSEDFTFTLMELILGEEGPDIEAYEKVDFVNEGEFAKKFFGGLDPKA
jgi:hypothetical protein